MASTALSPTILQEISSPGTVLCGGERVLGHGEHFDVHLIGQKFSMVTDHRALSYLQSMQNTNGRLT